MAYGNTARIGLEDNGHTAIMKVSEGNPGAVSVCAQLIAGGEKIDPDGFMGGLGTILGLDTHGIYGSRIWMLFKDVCGEHLGRMCGMLRAVQLGFFSDSDLDAMIDGQYSGEETIDGLISKVQERLPNFNLEANNGNG